MAWAAALSLLATSAWAHCPGTPPNITMTHPRAGVSIQEACYPDFGNYCQIDTLYQDTLRNILSARFRASRFVFLALVDSLESRLIFDTIIVNGEYIYTDTLVEETLHLAVLMQFKGNIPETRLTLKDTLPYFPPNFSPTTYIGLLDTAFLAFVQDSTYDIPSKLGIGPVDGCFFEPTALMLIQGRIHKKGFETDRMPGVSASLERFLAEVSVVSIPGLMTIEIRSNNLHFGLGKTRIRKTRPERNPAP